MNKNADETKQLILEAAFEEIHLVGFQAASISKILENTNLTKGALYHHFKNKMQLGYAVVEDILRPQIIDVWVHPLESHDNPIDGIKGVLAKHMHELTPEMISRGCPLNNLIQEMSPIDNGFRIRLQNIIDMWQRSLSHSFQKGQEHGFIREDVNPDDVAEFIMSVVEGVSSLSQSSQSTRVMEACAPQFLLYLEALAK